MNKDSWNMIFAKAVDVKLCTEEELRRRSQEINEELELRQYHKFQDFKKRLSSSELRHLLGEEFYKTVFTSYIRYSGGTTVCHGCGSTDRSSLILDERAYYVHFKDGHGMSLSITCDQKDISCLANYMISTIDNKNS